MDRRGTGTSPWVDGPDGNPTTAADRAADGPAPAWALAGGDGPWPWRPLSRVHPPTDGTPLPPPRLCAGGVRGVSSPRSMKAVASGSLSGPRAGSHPRGRCPSFARRIPIGARRPCISTGSSIPRKSPNSTLIPGGKRHAPQGAVDGARPPTRQGGIRSRTAGDRPRPPPAPPRRGEEEPCPPTPPGKGTGTVSATR